MGPRRIDELTVHCRPAFFASYVEVCKTSDSHDDAKKDLAIVVRQFGDSKTTNCDENRNDHIGPWLRCWCRSWDKLTDRHPSFTVFHCGGIPFDVARDAADSIEPWQADAQHEQTNEQDADDSHIFSLRKQQSWLFIPCAGFSRKAHRKRRPDDRLLAWIAWRA